jgi:hypothetical protein
MAVSITYTPNSKTNQDVEVKITTNEPVQSIT